MWGGSGANEHVTDKEYGLKFPQNLIYKAFFRKRSSLSISMGMSDSVNDSINLVRTVSTKHHEY